MPGEPVACVSTTLPSRRCYVSPTAFAVHIPSVLPLVVHRQFSVRFKAGAKERKPHKVHRMHGLRSSGPDLLRLYHCALFIPVFFAYCDCPGVQVGVSQWPRAPHATVP